MTEPASPVAECLHCRKGIRRNRAGIWGARKHDDPHPWFCGASPDDGKRHQPERVDCPACGACVNTYETGGVLMMVSHRDPARHPAWCDEGSDKPAPAAREDAPRITADSPAVLDDEAERLAREERWT